MSLGIQRATHLSVNIVLPFGWFLLVTWEPFIVMAEKMSLLDSSLLFHIIKIILTRIDLPNLEYNF